MREGRIERGGGEREGEREGVKRKRVEREGEEREGWREGVESGKEDRENDRGKEERGEDGEGGLVYGAWDFCDAVLD